MTRLKIVLALVLAGFSTIMIQEAKADNCSDAAAIYNANGYSCTEIPVYIWPYIVWQCSGQGACWTMLLNNQFNCVPGPQVPCS